MNNSEHQESWDYHNRLIHYVMANSSRSGKQAVECLDANCPQWRNANPPKASKIEITTGEYDEQ